MKWAQFIRSECLHQSETSTAVIVLRLYLSHRQVTMKHSKRQGHPAPTTRVNRWMSDRAAWDLNTHAHSQQDKNQSVWSWECYRWVRTCVFTWRSRWAPASMSICTSASSPAAEAYIRGVIPCRNKHLQCWYITGAYYLISHHNQLNN